MPSRIHVKFVTERKKYLEEQIKVLEPVLGNMKNVVAKSKAWLEEKTDQSSVSYIELSQELDTAATALLDVTSHISNEDNMDVNKPTPSLPQPDTQTTATFLTVESTRQLKTQVTHTADEDNMDVNKPTPSLPQPDTQKTATFLTVESTRQLKTQVTHTAGILKNILT
ncbi:uncharacterized protein LOC131947436 [Physella acuta]|uniref:uncharacterized protein LOC131947436 n=1 Tax=Physella acuta TaxID=109671 RepID=UPI0027DCB6DB|nr:uncharacterized protein LOC131947436 [Physella acuta]